MQCFKDTEGREYTIRLTLGAVEYLKASLGIDLLDVSAVDENGVTVLQKIIVDDAYLFNIVTTMLHNQFAQKNITKEEFLDCIDGEKAKEVSEKFFVEVQDFFTARGRRWVAIAIQKDREDLAKNLEELAVELAGETSSNPQEASA